MKLEERRGEGPGWVGCWAVHGEGTRAELEAFWGLSFQGVEVAPNRWRLPPIEAWETVLAVLRRGGWDVREDRVARVAEARGPTSRRADVPEEAP